ncbi:MAG TPA: OmpH family outer membrane protein [Myxococcales bacterium]|nr:OmpH family outer membrane protein [Myxococcales bacterium]
MRRIATAALLSTAVLCSAARAQAMKIGYVDVQRAIQEVEEGRAARTRLKTEFDSRKAQIDKKSADLERMQQEYEKQAPVLSDDAKRKKQEEFQKALVDARKSAGELQEDMNRQEQQAMASILQRLQQVVADIAEKESFTFVMDKGTLLYAPQAADITNEVVRRYNDRFGAGTAAGKAPPKTAQPAGKQGTKQASQPPPGK